MVGMSEMGLKCLNSDRSSFLKIGITLAILNLSRNMPVFFNWINNRVNDLMMAGSIIFNNFEEIPSQPQVFLLESFLFFSLQFIYLHFKI